MLGSRMDQFKDEEIVLRSVIAQRGPKPPLPSTQPPKSDDSLCASLTALNMSGSTSSSCSNEDESNLSPLKFERRQILSPVADSTLKGRDPFISLPWNVMYQIFNTFELKDRLTAAKVCKRWNRLLTDGRFPLGEISVLNLFEKSIWDQKLSQNIGGKVECIHLDEIDKLDTIFRHCLSPRVVKIWYESLTFLEKMLQRISNCKLKLHSLDAYPYSHYVGCSLIYEYLPQLKHIAMRPHGSDYFFKGLDMEYFPEFENLESLNIDSFNLVEDSKLPTNLRNLDWQCRNEKMLDRFISRLEPLKKLEFLTVGHANFDGISFLKFIQNVAYWNMQGLQYMYFKLVKFNIDSLVVNTTFSQRILHSLKVLRMELCYGNLRLVTNMFLRLTGSNLQILSLSLLTNETEFLMKDLFEMGNQFAERNLNVHLSLMEPNEPVIKKQFGEEESLYEIPICPNQFADLITKFEASFITEKKTLLNIIGRPYFANLTEIKLIQCSAANDSLLNSISESVLSCPECTEIGIRNFVENFHKHQVESLKIIWQMDRSQQNSTSFITDFYLSLSTKTPWLCEGLNLRCKRKQFRAKFGEQTIIWNKKKTLYIQDYDLYDQNRVLGAVLPTIEDQFDDNSRKSIVRRQSFKNSSDYLKNYE